MKKLVLTALALTMALSVTGCTPKTPANPDASDAPPAVTASAAPLESAQVSNVKELDSTRIVPMSPVEGQTQENTCYQTVLDESGNMFYVVQPNGGGEVMKVPVEETVLYGVSGDEECRITHVEFSYQNENKKLETVSQYRIYAPMENAISVDGETPTPVATPASNS